MIKPTMPAPTPLWISGDNQKNADAALALQALRKKHRLDMRLAIEVFPSLTNKALKNALKDAQQGAFLVQDGALWRCHLDDKDQIVKTAPNWQKMASRVVAAGRKSELLLQACKLRAGDTVVDATAGFCHDGLILASSGANVCAFERAAWLMLMLLFEKQTTLLLPNWQALLARLQLRYGDFLASAEDAKADVVYLDPMFAEQSHDAFAAVNKNMQTLRRFLGAASPEEENALLGLALRRLKSGGRVVVKRAVGADFFAHKAPDQSWQNKALRFDAYFAQS